VRPPNGRLSFQMLCPIYYANRRVAEDSGSGDASRPKSASDVGQHWRRRKLEKPGRMVLMWRQCAEWSGRGLVRSKTSDGKARGPAQRMAADESKVASEECVKRPACQEKGLRRFHQRRQRRFEGVEVRCGGTMQRNCVPGRRSGRGSQKVHACA